ncbi:MAG: response regulator transcription factor [Verrucomicrobiota bacterium]
MIRVLIVDDHQILRRGLKEVLAEGYSDLIVGEAQNFDEAVEMLVQEDWNLLLLDINIPGRNGLEVLQEAKRLRPKTAVLIVSAYPEVEFAIRSFKLGASGYLCKSQAAEELLGAVKRILGGRKYVTAALADRLASILGGEPPPAHENLSSRELQVLQLIASGSTVKQIASHLTLSEKTLATYRTRISDKLGLRTNVELARYTFLHKLVE